MVHPLLRTAMQPNELFNKNQKKIQIRVDDLIPFERLNAFEQDQDLIEYLRLRTYHLELRSNIREMRVGKTLLPIIRKENEKTVLPPRSTGLLAEEIYQLPPSQILIESGDHMVIQSEAGQIPNLLSEIGRLREITFRAVGEGTGKPLDLDRFDASYVHIFIWNREKREVVCAYRLGKTDEIMRKHGMRGLYTSTLFHYKQDFFECLGPALELGRSFVRLEYQKSYTPLLLLWKGIARFIVDNPRYKTLFGPVSITREYQALSKQLMINYLKVNRYRTDLAGFIRPRRPHRLKTVQKMGHRRHRTHMLKDDSDNISDLISCIEE